MVVAASDDDDEEDDDDDTAEDADDADEESSLAVAAAAEGVSSFRTLYSMFFSASSTPYACMANALREREGNRIRKAKDDKTRIRMRVNIHHCHSSGELDS